MNVLKELHRYQDLQQRVQKLNKEQSALMVETAMTEAMERLARITAQLAAIEETISDTKRRMKRWEDENNETQGYLRQSEKKLYDGTITQAKELTQMQQKNDEYRETIRKTDETIFGLMELIEEKESELQKLQDEESKLARNISDLEAKNHQQNIRFEKEIAEAKSQAAEMRQGIAPELLSVFDKISRAHHGIAIAELQGDTCGACHVSLSSAIVQRIKKNDTLQTCENCGRIVYLP